MKMNKKRMALILAALSMWTGCARIYAAGSSAEKDYIKWVDFGVSAQALQDAMETDIDTHDTERPIDWVELLAALGTRYGGDFARYKKTDLTDMVKNTRRELIFHPCLRTIRHSPIIRKHTVLSLVECWENTRKSTHRESPERGTD